MNNRITEYSARYQYQIFGVGQIVGLQRIIGVFFYRILDILAENQMLQLLDGKKSFPVGLSPKNAKKTTFSGYFKWISGVFVHF
jgi:hypothetical protein